MPFRLKAPPAARRLLKSFHTSAPCESHYDTLKVAQNASAKDIKKSFYSLSKTHHPDHNPNDPEASTRFVEISEAYAILGSPERRQRYDRDFLRTASHGTITPKGSYHSSGPAGGRSPSGLSRRRTHFHGPPPSFYRSGGWGEQGAKRRVAHDGVDSGSFTGGNGPKSPSVNGGDMGFGDHQFGAATDVPHFDREAHFRTHSNQERRRRSRNREDEMPVQTGRGMFRNFMFISGILATGIVLPGFVLEHMIRVINKEN